MARVVLPDLQCLGGIILENMRRLIALAAFSGVVAAQEQAPVILISIDTLRADHLSAYGYRKIQTPNIDSFAERGTVFTDVNSQIPLTLPSHTSLMTSTYPFENGLEENAEVVPAGAVTLASILRSHGYKTAAFVGSNILDRRCGLDQGFEEYDSPFGGERVRRDGALVLRAASAWLGAHRNQPVFLFVHLFDLHTPYQLRPGKGTNEPETAGYDAELGYVDQILGRFRHSLIDNGWWKKSMVVVIADHGESLGDHGEWSHGYFIYESTLHVPLLVHWPDGAPKHSERVTEPGGLIDVAPTILDALRLAIPRSYAGISLLNNGAHGIYSESVYARDSFRWAALRSLREGRWKYIEAPHAELFDLEKDPGEQSNVLRGNEAVAATMRSELSRLMAAHARANPPAVHDSSLATKKLMESLGYLSGGARKPPLGREPDPKDRLAEYQMYDRALDAMYAQRLDRAIRGFLQVLAQDRDNVAARGSLGDAYLRYGKSDDAVRAWNAALQSDPQYAPAAEALGEFYMRRADWRKACPYFLLALAAVPADSTVRVELQVVVEHLRTDCKENPSSAGCNNLREAEREMALK
jgi:choline-sulfatase